MAVVVETAPRKASPAVQNRRDWRLWVLVAAVVLAFAPWLAAQSRMLWRLPHYQFFPLLPAAALALGYRGTRELGPLSPGAALVTFGLLGLSWLLAAVAAVVYSPAAGTVAALVALAALAHGLGGRRLLRALAPAVLVLALAVRPPLGIDTEITYHLQTLATLCSSRALDVLGVFHLAEGHVLEIPEHRLYVEQACSGITSLFVVLSVTLGAALWARRSALATSALLMAGAVWVLVGNVARITIGAYALSRWKIDVTSGTSHEALGLLILGVVLGLMFSTDQLFRQIASLSSRAFDLMADLLTRSRRAEEVSRRELRGECVFPPLDVPTPDVPSEPTRWPRAKTTWIGTWPVILAFLALAAANGAAAWGEPSYESPALERRLAVLGANDLPDHWGPLKRASFKADRIPAQNMGWWERHWLYRPPGTPSPSAWTATAEVADPFIGWHEVTDCYQARGWVVESRTVVPGRNGACVVLRMSQPLEGTGLLLFALDDARGLPLRPPVGAGWLGVLAERLTQGWWRLHGSPRGTARESEGAGPSYLVQLLIQSQTPLTTEEEARAVTFLNDIRAAIRLRVRSEGDG